MFLVQGNGETDRQGVHFIQASDLFAPAMEWSPNRSVEMPLWASVTFAKETGETRKAYLLLSLPQQHVMSVSVYQLLLASVSIAFSLAGAVVGFVSATLAQAKNGPAQHMRVAAHQKLNRL